MSERYPAHIPPALAEVLGMPPYALHPWWAALRDVGVEVPARYEGEVASALFFLIPFAVCHKENWRHAAISELERLKEGGRSSVPAYSADARLADGSIVITSYSSTDPGPVFEFRPIATLSLDEAHASELMGTLALALSEMREAV